MIKVGINGFGRIGKCCFLQLIDNDKFEICCLNALNIKISEIEDYLLYDSTHSRYNRDFQFSIISETEFRINRHTVKLLSDRNAANLNWRATGCEYLIDATGAYLTTKKCIAHNVDYIIMSAPCKDDSKTLICGVNMDNYRGEKVVSGSSCTTNCIAPILKLLNDAYTVTNCVFTTIHATTASQYTVDIVDKSLRTNRSILNNIIPHTTGASSSVTCVLPELVGKINGTSLRVPVSNCSLLDVNIELKDSTVKLKDIEILMKNHPLYKTVFDISNKKLVSSDFMTTTTPTILDSNASIDMGNGKIKLMIWYDNEWSYSAQLIRVIEGMYQYNSVNRNVMPIYHMRNIIMENKAVVCRLDLNVPTLNGAITDDYRIVSALSTIEYILSQKPTCLVLTAHFGRPKGVGREEKYSLEFLIPTLEKHLKRPVKFLEDGISDITLSKLHRPANTEYINKPYGVYLMENLRFHKEETDYEDMSEEEKRQNTTINKYKNIGDVFICDAFGCLHREHMSICAAKHFDRPHGYGNLIQRETRAIEQIVNNKGSKILAIIGGNKIQDKLPIINSFRVINNTKVFVAGGLAKHYADNYSNVIRMHDGIGNDNLTLPPIQIDDIMKTPHNVYDIGKDSLDTLFNLVQEADIIFWNGSLGVIESDVYKQGSLQLIEYLQNTTGKTIIMGGGETASLIQTKDSKIYVSTGGGALLEYLEAKLRDSNIIGLEHYTGKNLGANHF
jgi:glyceraldehyde 3-phosphate dehydrogenase